MSASRSFEMSLPRQEKIQQLFAFCVPYEEDHFLTIIVRRKPGGPWHPGTEDTHFGTDSKCLKIVLLSSRRSDIFDHAPSVILRLFKSYFILAEATVRASSPVTYRTRCRQPMTMGWRRGCRYLLRSSVPLFLARTAFPTAVILKVFSLAMPPFWGALVHCSHFIAQDKQRLYRFPLDRELVRWSKSKEKWKMSLIRETHVELKLMKICNVWYDMRWYETVVWSLGFSVKEFLFLASWPYFDSFS